MNLKSIFYSFSILIHLPLFGQVGINTTNPHSSAALDINASTKLGGLLIPRVNLLSTSDITTITNPQTGLLVYNLNSNSNPLDPIYANYLYRFDGNRWKRLSTREELVEANPDLPYVVAYGRKTTVEPCVSSTAVEAQFMLNELSNPNLISSGGQFTAPEDGYYSFSAMANLYVLGDPGATFSQSPYIYADGLTTFVFKFRGSETVIQNNPRTIVGVVYLEKGQTTNPFYWNRGRISCSSSASNGSQIKDQQVVWEYISQP